MVYEVGLEGDEHIESVSMSFCGYFNFKYIHLHCVIFTRLFLYK